MEDCTSYETTASLMSGTKQENKFRHFWQLVGNTPMLEIDYRYKKNAEKYT